MDALVPMTRAALLPAGSDPFLIAYWLRNYATWADRVDELHIAVCGPLEPEALAYIAECVAAVPHATMFHVGRRTDHGAVLLKLLARTQASHIMFCEDDAFVRRPEVIDECFAFAESGGIAATPRGGYASHELTDAATRAFGEQYAYWPCFVFVGREHLFATDLEFGGMNWTIGETLLGHQLRESAVADTFVWASYQLRALGIPEELRDNYRMSGQPIPDDAPWIHVGSLSSGHGYLYMTPVPHPAYQAEIAMFGRLPEGNALQRVAWWQRAWERARGAIPEYHERYGVGLATLCADIGIGQAEIEAYQRTVDPLVTWAES